MLRLQKIDEHTRPDHSYLAEDDECYYLREYTPRQGPYYSSTNDLIINLKKPVDRRGRAEYQYKESAIGQAGDELRSVLNADWLKKAVLVPMPCSKAKGEALYDDRLLRVIHRMTLGLDCAIRDLVLQTGNLPSFHDGCRLPPNMLVNYYKVDELLCAGANPEVVGIFDDVLTTGSHFKAVKAVIQGRWPGVPVIGVFIARRYIPRDELAATDAGQPEG
jgi:hypothetical protein